MNVSTAHKGVLGSPMHWLVASVRVMLRNSCAEARGMTAMMAATQRLIVSNDFDA